MNPNGTGLQQMTFGNYNDAHPLLSPDGSRIAFFSNRHGPSGDFQVYMMDSDGAHITQLTNYAGGSSASSWSPDGTKIVFSLNASIYTIKPDGTSLRAVITPTYSHNAYYSGFSHPYFSPTGSYITSVGFTSYNGGQDDVFRATSSGGSLTNVTNTGYPANETPVGWR